MDITKKKKDGRHHKCVYYLAFLEFTGGSIKWYSHLEKQFHSFLQSLYVPSACLIYT